MTARNHTQKEQLATVSKVLSRDALPKHYAYLRPDDDWQRKRKPFGVYKGRLSLSDALVKSLCCFKPLLYLIAAITTEAQALTGILPFLLANEFHF